MSSALALCLLSVLCVVQANWNFEATVGDTVQRDWFRNTPSFLITLNTTDNTTASVSVSAAASSDTGASGTLVLAIPSGSPVSTSTINSALGSLLNVAGRVNATTTATARRGGVNRDSSCLNQSGRQTVSFTIAPGAGAVSAAAIAQLQALLASRDPSLFNNGVCIDQFVNAAGSSVVVASASAASGQTTAFGSGGSQGDINGINIGVGVGVGVGVPLLIALLAALYCCTPSAPVRTIPAAAPVTQQTATRSSRQQVDSYSNDDNDYDQDSGYGDQSGYGDNDDADASSY